MGCLALPCTFTFIEQRRAIGIVTRTRKAKKELCFLEPCHGGFGLHGNGSLVPGQCTDPVARLLKRPSK